MKLFFYFFFWNLIFLSHAFSFQEIISIHSHSSPMIVIRPEESKKNWREENSSKEAIFLQEEEKFLLEKMSFDSEDFKKIRYSVNLMWIYQEGVHEELAEKKAFDALEKWADVTEKEHEINFWYDSKFVSQEAIQKAKDSLIQLSQLHPQWPSIYLRDLREFPELQKEDESRDLFGEKTPLYWRIDLLKILPVFHLQDRVEEDVYFIQSDIDVVPLSKEKLFSEKILKKLHYFGFVLSGDRSFPYENSFHIIGKKKPHFLKSLKQKVIREAMGELPDRILQLRRKYSYRGVPVDGGNSGFVFDRYKKAIHDFYEKEDWLSFENENRVRIKNPAIAPKRKAYLEFKCDMLTSCLYPVIWVERPNSQFGMVGRVKKLESDLSEDGYYRLFRRFKKCPDTTSEEDVFQLIHLAAKNSLNDAFFEIAERIPASRLLHLFSVKSYQEYSMGPAVTSLDFAVDLGNYEMIRIAFERISTESQASETEFLQKIYESFLRFSENYIKSRSTWDKKTKYEVGHVKLMNMLRNIFSEEKYQSLRKDLVSAVCYYEEQPHCDVPHDDPFHDQKPNVRETIFSEIVRNLSSQELVELMSQRSSCGGFSEKSILDVAILQGKHQVISEILEKVKNDSSCLSQVQDLISKETTFLKSRKENR